RLQRHRRPPDLHSFPTRRSSDLCAGGATGNNGQIQCIQDTTGTQEAGRSVSYTYDALYRLKTAQTNGSAGFPQWGLSWTYDRYGDRKSTRLNSSHGSISYAVFCL